MFTHNIYRNLRVVVIIVRDGKVLLFPPESDGTGRHPCRTLPGGGLEPNEGLYEAGAREALEETGLRVKVRSVAFLRECVVPKCVPAHEMRRVLGIWDARAQELGIEVGPAAEDQGLDHAYALEVYLWAELRDEETAEPRPDDVLGARAEWVPLAEVEHEPLFPIELKALARDLAQGRAPIGVPVFTTGLEDPWAQPVWDAFRGSGSARGQA